MKVNAQVANFNVVFGDDEKPMLDYFDTIVYPVLTSGLTRKCKDEDEYFLHEIELTTNKNDDAIVVGKIVKSTMLEIHSDLNEEGELVEKNEHYSSAPYSTFVIYLRNHRMLFVPNQKGSPTLVNFRSTIAYMFKKFVDDYNATHDEELPYAIVNIVGVPSAESIEELLKKVKKINSLTLKFYPLNGDIDFSELFGMMNRDLRKKVGSKTGQIILNSPKSADGVATVVEQASGTVEPIIKATTQDNRKVKIQNDQMSEKHELEIDEGLPVKQKTEQIKKKADTIVNLQFTNDNHNEIYRRNINKIMRFIKIK